MILRSAIQASLDLWMLLRISFKKFDTEPPCNINDDDELKPMTELQRYPKDTFTATSVQLALIELLPVRLRIVQLLNSLHSEISYDQQRGPHQPALPLDAALARLMATAGGLFREGIRCATSAISLKLLAHVETQHLNGTLHRTRQYRDFLKQAVRDHIPQSEERIWLALSS
ncbi:uncharacterized protein P174DRAFT_436111 [Aspergillus novofumigatus IBT 16806]|uniref:Uncharacterized protein n=1 Tax=Aspergillus novofumigatus (strain IBT 16806) TaxID=1392255 RepID=A0A2I1BTC3_ASPN1|nr:uncharacterized protein P174DRAFT_436111 [Aspergillus novofumigatus IBT 16806]PKX88602.1 hypothetical protein P174DRAFT_436111 [Aspergillus novofumigatus IBT 16806]